MLLCIYSKAYFQRVDLGSVTNSLYLNDQLKVQGARGSAPTVMCREADLITITDKTDLQQAMNDAMEAAERSASLPGHGTRGLPLQSLLAGHPLKLQLLRCKEVRAP